LFQSSKICDRRAFCLNFRRDGPSYCSACGTLINMNHFHENQRNYRLCNSCFLDNLSRIASDSFAPPSTIAGETEECANHEQCFAQSQYSIYTPKVCDLCGCYPVAHYHEITRNIRLCLRCYLLENNKGNV
jgi:hypothetical protein